MESGGYLGGAGNRLVRRSFVIDRPVAEAVLTMRADPVTYSWPAWMEIPNLEHNWLMAGSMLKFRVQLNGTAAAVGPLRPVCDGSAVEQSFDVTSRLRTGENVIGVVSRGEQYGFWARLTIRFADGDALVIVGDRQWRSWNANEFYCPVCWWRPQLSARGNFGPGEPGENPDGENFPFGWDSPGFDDSGWAEAEPTAQADVYPVEPAELEPLELNRLAPVSSFTTADGRRVFDFGRPVCGYLELTSPEAGTIEVRQGEELLPYGKGGVRFFLRTGNVYQSGWRFPEGGGTLTGFGLRSFRYVELVGAPVAAVPVAVAVNQPFAAQDGEVMLADERLQRLWRLCKQTIQFTGFDLYIDCPSRERMVYEADLYINMLTHFAVEHRTALARRSIRYQMNHYTWPCEWRLFLIPIVREYFWHTGDLALVAELYERLKTECSFHRLLRNGLVEEFPMRVIVDWPVSCRDEHEFGPNDAVPNAFVYRDLVDLAELAGFLGKSADQREFSQLAAEVKNAFNRRLFDPEQGLFVDHTGSRHAGFHANVFALAFDVAEPENVPQALDFIDRAGMRGSVYTAQFYLDALCRHGRVRRAVELMTDDGPRSWLRMLADGAGVTTEAWNAELKPNMSLVHPWGSAPGNVIVRWIFGLRPLTPGWIRYAVEPNPGGIAHGHCRLRTPGGVVESRF